MSVKSQQYFCIIPEWVLYHPDLSPRSIQLYGVLDRYANEQKHAHPSRKELAQKCNCGRTAIDRSLTELKDAQAIVVTPRQSKVGDQTSNDYLLIQRPPLPENGETPLPVNDETPSPKTGNGNRAIETEPFETEKSSKKAPRKRQPDPLWDALAAVIPTDAPTGSQRASWNKALKELRDAGATPQSIRARAGEYKARFRGAVLTPNALAKHWGTLIQPPSRYSNGRPPPEPPRDEEAIRDLDVAIENIGGGL